MKLSDYVAQYLLERRIKQNYIFTGGAVAHLIDSCWAMHNDNPEYLKPICVLHEQAGSMALDAFTRATGELGVMMVTSGPGATNLLTGIACSYYDSIPGIYFTGQVRTWECKGESNQRQLGFQETDIVSMALPVTKYAVMLTDAADIKYELDKAFYLATTDRPGPVLIDIPMDLQWAEIDPSSLRSFVPPQAKFDSSILSDRNLRLSAEIMAQSSKPIIIAGGGIRNSRAISQLHYLSENFSIPVAVTFGGKDSYPHQSQLFAGLIGTMGNRATNENVNEADVVIVVGSRLSWRQIRSRPDKFAPHAKIIHVDIDASEINQQVMANVSLPMDAGEFLHYLSTELKTIKYKCDSEWPQKCNQRLRDNPFLKIDAVNELGAVDPYYFFHILSQEMAANDVAVIDAGQNVMWGMQALEPNGRQRILTAWGHSPMGYSLPASIGPALHYSGTSTNVVCTIGDGGFQVNIQELQTIKYYNVPTKIFILNNHSYGAIKDFQDGNLNSRYYGTIPEYGYEAPDFISISNSYGLKTEKISNNGSVRDGIRKALSVAGPIVVDVDLGTETSVILDPV